MGGVVYPIVHINTMRYLTEEEYMKLDRYCYETGLTISSIFLDPRANTFRNSWVVEFGALVYTVC